MLMQIDYRQLTSEQRTLAVQRLTALWAFTESGLGGIMHALQIPFTGLLVGGMAIVMICLIAKTSDDNYKQVLKSAVIVLIVKAMVSPHTPPPAYLAVSFQALLGYSLFKLMGIHFFSILLLSTLAMVESAIQKILILTLFYGQSLWKATDNLVNFIASQFGLTAVNGSYWIVGTYLFIYIFGGVLIAWLAAYSIHTLYNGESIEKPIDVTQQWIISTNQKKKNYTKLWSMIIILLLLSLSLFFFAPDNKRGWLAVLKTVSWTVTAILTWYVFISPVLSKIIRRILKKQQHRYSEEVLQVVSFLPVLKQLTASAWQRSKKQAGLYRWRYFFSLLIHFSLLYNDNEASKTSSQTDI
jgi:hypothetical protein